MKTISVIVPVYNEAEGIKRFLDTKLLPVVENLKGYHTEIIFVEDGSTDRSYEILSQYAKKNKSIKLLCFSRNFGKEAALSAGFKYAKGDAAITIDADGQQPPKLIPQFIEKWEVGAEVVTGVRDHFTDHGFIQKVGSNMQRGSFKWQD